MTRCLACSSEAGSFFARAGDAEYFSVAEEFDFYRCDSCGAVSIDPVPHDRLSEIYPDNYYSYADVSQSVVHRLKNFFDRRAMAGILSAIPGDSLVVLDVGGGSGWLASVARHADSRVTRTHVVDLDSGAEQHARANGHEFTLSSIEDFPGEECFDLILLLNLIEHVENPGAVLEKCRNHLNPDGRLLVQTPNVSSLDARIFRSRYWGGLHAPRHWCLFDERSILPVIAQAGLKPDRVSYTQGAPFWTFSVLDMLRRKGWVHADRNRPLVYHPLSGPLMAFFALFDFARMPFSKASQMRLVLRRT